MTKIVLAASSEEKLRELSERLTENNIQHYLWIEQPENTPSALATCPGLRDTLKPYLKDLKLFK